MSEMPQSKQGPSASPQSALLALITAFMPARVVHAAAELGLADLLAAGTKTSADLARETGTHAPSLHRLMRALASLGLVDESEPGRFALTPLGTQLRRDVPGSQRNLALMFGGERAWRCWEALLHSVRTGEAAMQHVYGMGSFEYLAAHPEAAMVFNTAMAEITRQVARAVVAAYDFARFRRIVDVGGGNGTLLAAILAAAPLLHGIVFDLPAGNAEAPRLLAAAGLTQRAEVIAGDFFKAVPEGADAYILKSVIHDWGDGDSTAILRSCRNAIAAGGRLLLLERVMPERMAASPAHQRMAMLDMNMLALPGGRERTEAEYRTLFQAAGFTLERILPLSEGGGVSLIEAAPV